MNIDDKYWDIVFLWNECSCEEQRGTAYGVFPENSDIAEKQAPPSFQMDKRSGDDVPEELRDHGSLLDLPR
ncbi:MAG: hypothetical protein Ct9H90mP13_00230 [Pseudomonadota bacterium]|nr:MAG: hypothetical protein Ct9H90mP13_00230 [Pseudomonadota bacterium]